MPGGRIPNQNNPPAAKGVGKNAKRHDLEVGATPGLGGSDLQVGDVAALEQGQRIAPITKQAPAQAVPPAGRRVQAGPDGGNPEMADMIRGRLGNTLGQDTNLGEPDQAAQTKAQAWLSVLTQAARQPGASPLLKARVQTTLRDQVARGAHRPQGGVARLSEVDETLEAFDGGQR